MVGWRGGVVVVLVMLLLVELGGLGLGRLIGG